MKKLFFAITLLAIVIMAIPKTECQMTKQNKGSTTITMLAFNVSPSTVVDMNMIESTTVELFSGTISVSQAVEAIEGEIVIEQGVKNISPQGSMIMTNTSQMQVIENTAQWRNDYLVNSSLCVNMAMMDLATAVPSVWLMTENVSISAEFTSQDMLTIQKVWPVSTNSSNFAGATIDPYDLNAMQNESLKINLAANA